MRPPIPFFVLASTLASTCLSILVISLAGFEGNLSLLEVVSVFPGGLSKRKLGFSFSFEADQEGSPKYGNPGCDPHKTWFFVSVRVACGKRVAPLWLLFVKGNANGYFAGFPCFGFHVGFCLFVGFLVGFYVMAI